MTDKTTAVLERLRDDVPVHPAPVDVLVGDARAMRHRRRTALASVAAAACAAVAVGIVAAPTILGTRGEFSDIVVNQPLQPAGTQLVGVGSAAVAIPESWTGPNIFLCGRPADVVYYDKPLSCTGRSEGLDRLEVTTTEVTSTDSGNAMTLMSRVGGYEVVDSGVQCDLEVGGACWRSFGVPDLDAYFTVTVGDAAVEDLPLLDEVRESLVVLDDTQAVVPQVRLPLEQGDDHLGVDRVAAALQEAGLEPVINELPCDDTGLCVGGVVGTTPSAGSVVPPGSTVTINVID